MSLEIVNEIWKTIPGTGDRYEASTLGRIRNAKTGRIIGTGDRNERGYLRANLQGQRHTVHSLVLLTFVGPRPEGLECCHKNDCRDDNKLSNLRYDTPEANRNDRRRNKESKAA